MSDRFFRPRGFAARNERERLLEAFALLASTSGFDRVDADAVDVLAGVPEGTFASAFATPEAAVLAAYDVTVEQAFSAAAEAFASTGGTWAEGIHAALGALLGFISQAPTFARVAAVDVLRTGERGLAVRTRAIAQFAEFLRPAYENATAPIGDLSAEVVAGGIIDLLRRHVMDDRLAELPAALPELTVLTLAPFVGEAEALRVAGR